MSMNRKKKATAAVDVGFAWEVPDQNVRALSAWKEGT